MYTISRCFSHEQVDNHMNLTIDSFVLNKTFGYDVSNVSTVSIMQPMTDSVTEFWE